MLPSSSHPSIAWRRGVLALIGIAIGVAGCLHPGPASSPLSLADTATAFSDRNLHDPGLHRFLVENLGREPATWDFENLSWVAFYYHPSLEVARAQWAVARAAQATASARPNPTVGIVPGYSTNAPSGTSPWFPALSLDFPLETAGKREQRTAAEKFSAEAARLAVLSAAWQVRGDLRRALLEAVNASHHLPLLQAVAEAQRTLVHLLEQRVAAGSIAAGEVSAARIALVRADASMVEARGQLTIARGHIAAALGIPVAGITDLALDDSLVPGAAPLDETALAAARRESLQSRADVLGALARYESAQAALQLETAKRYPDIHLGPGYQWDQGQNKWSLGLTIELPLFNRNEGPIAEAAARRAEAAAQLNATQAQVIVAIDNAVAAQTAALAQLDHARQVRAELDKQAARVQALLAAGGADQFEAQSAQLESRTAELAVADADAASRLAAGELEDALQVPFSNLNAIANLSREAAQPRTP